MVQAGLMSNMPQYGWAEREGVQEKHKGRGGGGGIEEECEYE